MSSGSEWATAITDIHPNKVLLRGYPIDQLMGSLSYAQAVYLAIKGELPDERTGKLMEAMLVSSIDHGVTPPSALAAMTAASTGAPLNAAIAGGILAINKFHGGAIESAMETFYDIHAAYTSDPESELDSIVSSILDAYKARKKRIMGFGHRIHTDDPRTKKLFRMAEELNLAGDFVAMARSVEKKLAEQTGKHLPINVDGAIAALLCELDFQPSIANGFFIMARIPGLIAHINEEQTTQKPMRKIDPDGWKYTGPQERHIK